MLSAVIGRREILGMITAGFSAQIKVFTGGHA
jgi:hypothetical protein